MSKAAYLRKRFDVWAKTCKRDVHYIDIFYTPKPDFEIARGENRRGEPNYVRLSGWYLEIEFMDTDRNIHFLGENYEVARRRIIGTLGSYQR